MSGKLVVIDGADGSGKATQANLLYERLRKEGIRVQKLDFPRYTENFFGKLIRECLDGKYGDFISIHPKIVSALYAADRFESTEQINAWIKNGALVILDRYVSANMMHQGSKLSDEEELVAFLEWLNHMEHEVFKIPRPHKIIYLDVPHAIRRELVSKDSTRGEADLAERDHAHQIASEKCAKKIATLSQDWQVISCVHEGSLRPKEAIHEDIYTCIQDFV